MNDYCALSVLMSPSVRKTLLLDCFMTLECLVIEVTHGRIHISLSCSVLLLLELAACNFASLSE